MGYHAGLKAPRCSGCFDEKNSHHRCSSVSADGNGEFTFDDSKAGVSAMAFAGCDGPEKAARL